jgi:hypothetical protein
MCNKSNDSSRLKAKDNSCEQKLYISSDKGIETMEVKTNADIHDTNNILRRYNLLLYELWSLWQGSLYMCYWLL